MANNPKKKKVVVTTSSSGSGSSKLKATKSRSETQTNNTGALIFNKENYKWVGIGIALIAVGMLLMIGGFNEDPAVWNEDKIYGFQRTTLAPFVILSGLIVEVYAIFK